MRKTWLALALTAAVVAIAAVLLIGSGDDEPAAQQEPNIVQAGAPGEPSRSVSGDDAKVDVPKPTAEDVAFAEGMIHHHAQGVQMTEFVPDRSAGRDLPLLAERMKVSQQSEIELMEKWLAEQGAAVPGMDEHAHHMGSELMPGMLTEAELARLKAGRGEKFNRLFLTFMVRHHQGALTMIRELQAAGGGAEPELDNLIRHIDSDQTIEIGRMRQLLAEQ